MLVNYLLAASEHLLGLVGAKLESGLLRQALSLKQDLSVGDIRAVVVCVLLLHGQARDQLSLRVLLPGQQVLYVGDGRE